MKVLLVNENVGGHAVMHLHLRRALAELQDADAAFFDLPPPGLARRIFGASLPVLGRLDADLQPLRWQLAQSLQVRRRVRSWPDDYDVLHLYTQNAGLLLTGELASRPSVVSVDGTNELNAYDLPYRAPTRWTARALVPHRRVEQRVFDAATMVVAQSQWAADSLREHYRVSDDRLRIVRFGITVPPEAPRHARSDRLPEVTFIGSSMERKGGWRLVRVYRQSLRGACTLNLVTRDDVAEEPGIRVIRDIVPGDPRLPSLLARTDVFVFPSEIDKSSYAVMEAMVCGVPVVTTRQGALPELVPDGVAGRLVDPGDDDQLREVLGRLLDDEGERRRLGRAARQRILDLFDARVTTAQLVGVLRKAVERYDGGRRRVRRGGVGRRLSP